MLQRFSLFCIFAFCLNLGNCLEAAVLFHPIEGFSEAANERIAAFFENTESIEGRKVAVFDFDGTLCGQRPNYADSELFVLFAENGLIDNRNLPQTKVTSSRAHPVKNLYALKEMNEQVADTWRARVLDGVNLKDLQQQCLIFMLRHYMKKIFTPMADLVRQLHRKGFEVWVVTAATEAFVEPFIVQQLRIHPTRIIGMRTEIHDGLLSNTLAGPLTNGEGKVQAIETTIKAKPLLVAGNSMGDVPMLKLAEKLSIMINPKGKCEKVAKEDGWLIETIEDAVFTDAPHLYRRFGGKGN